MGLYNIISRANSSLYITANGSGEVDRTKIIVLPSTGFVDQSWNIPNPNSSTQQEVTTGFDSTDGNKYKLNANRSQTPWFCDIHTTNADTKLVFEPTSTTDVYRIRLNGADSNNLYMTAVGVSGSPVQFKANLGTSNTTQQWTLRAVTTPARPTNFTYTTITRNSIPLHIVETPASNIAVLTVKKYKMGIPVPYCGCNAGFFDNDNDKENLRTYNISLNNGMQTGPDTFGTTNTCGTGNIAYVSGRIECVVAANKDSLISAIGTPVWAQGGGMLYLGDSSWKSKWVFPHGTESVSTGRTALIANKSTKKVFLVVTQNGPSKSISDFRTAIQQHFGITDGSSTNYVGIMLDGGGSSCLRVYNSSGSRVGPDAGRHLCQILYIKA